MAPSAMAVAGLLATFALFPLLSQAVVVTQGLSADYYTATCPNVTRIVSDIFAPYFAADPTTAAPIIRLPFHDCWVSGCDASLLLTSTPTMRSEQEADSSLTLGGYDIVDAVKTALENACPATVSCADVLILLAREATIRVNGPAYDVLLGRKDGYTAYYQQVQDTFPGQNFNVTQLILSSAGIGLTTVDLVAVSGAHTVGQAHCSSFDDRLYGKAKTLDNKYATTLRKLCPPPAREPALLDQNSANLDVSTPNTFDNYYFINMLNNTGLLNSDEELYYDSRTKPSVQAWATSQDAFFKQYAISINRMNQVNVLTGSQGNVRLKCSVLNS